MASATGHPVSAARLAGSGDPRDYSRALGRFATGVAVVTVADGDDVRAATVNGFLSVSKDPPLVLVSVAEREGLHDAVRSSGRYGVSVLAHEQRTLAWHFAGRPDPDARPRFAWLDGLPLLEGALARVCARVVDAHPAGDHTLYLGLVEHLDWRDGRPLLFFTGASGAVDVGLGDASFLV
jgi:flavin reductase (DIM6/NTAB) family NADH-FMN oxidoreductase RutF